MLSVVLGITINDNDFIGDAVLFEDVGDGIEKLTDVLFFVVGGNNEGEHGSLASFLI